MKTYGTTELETPEQYKDALKRKKKLTKKATKVSKKIGKLNRRILNANVKHDKIATAIVNLDEKIAEYDEQNGDRFDVQQTPPVTKPARKRA